MCEHYMSVKIFRKIDLEGDLIVRPSVLGGSS